MTSVVLAAANVQWIVFSLLAIVLVLGLLATFAPDRFAHIAQRGSKWIDTDQVVKFLEKPIDVDRHVLRYSRVLGVLVTLAALWLAYLYWTHLVAR